MTLVAYSPLLSGGYTTPGKELDRASDHPGTGARLRALDQVVRETGATANQVVLAWLTGSGLPVVPLIGASCVAQLDENLAAVDLQLSAEHRQLLDAAN
jgi:aryl-alcohol dehydrogenase-like predicted oxidoreductase